MEPSILVIIYSLFIKLCELFECAGILMDQVKRKLFSLSLKGRAPEWYKKLKNRRSICWEEIVPLFYYKFYPPSKIHKDRNQIYNFWPKAWREYCPSLGKKSWRLVHGAHTISHCNHALVAQ